MLDTGASGRGGFSNRDLAGGSGVAATSTPWPIQSQRSTPGQKAKPVVMPEIFDGMGRDTWKDYLEHFTACAEVNGWNDHDKCDFFAVRLRGSAQQVYVDLPQSAKVNFCTIASAFESFLT